MPVSNRALACVRYCHSKMAKLPDVRLSALLNMMMLDYDSKLSIRYSNVLSYYQIGQQCRRYCSFIVKM